MDNEKGLIGGSDNEAQQMAQRNSTADVFKILVGIVLSIFLHTILDIVLENTFDNTSHIEYIYSIDIM